MKNRIIAAFAAFIMSAGAFFMPLEVYAQSEEDTAPPVLRAEVSDGVLSMEAVDSGSGVDAVYVGGKRINYRVDGAVDVDLRDYAGTNQETVEAYAVDFAGNQSRIVEVANPYFETADASSAFAKTGSVTATGTGTNTPSAIFTPDGQADVTDSVSEQEGKEFYTFTTPKGNVFYLVIDRKRDTDNVYFLNAVTEKDLGALAQKEEADTGNLEQEGREAMACTCTVKCAPGSIDTSCAACFHAYGMCEGKEAEVPKEHETGKENEDGRKKGTGGMAVLFLFVALAAAGGWYLKIYKPKRELGYAEDLEDLLDDGPEVNEDDLEEDLQESIGEEMYGSKREEDTMFYDDYPDSLAEGSDGDA